MDPDIDYLTEFFEKNPPADPGTFNSIVESIDVQLPDDYLDFMRESNGGEGGIRKGQWLRLWPIEEINQANIDYKVAEYAPDLLLIGSNGGSLGFGIKRKERIFVAVDMYDNDDDVYTYGESFKSFLQGITVFGDGSEFDEE